MRSPLPISAVLVVLGATIVPAAAAAPVPVAVRLTAACPTVAPLVRLSDGTVGRVAHADPGPTLARVTPATRNLFVVVRVGATWGTVKRAPGHVLQLTADGPRGEQWRWRYAVAARNPERDTSNYLVCLRPLTRQGSFARHLRGRTGRWRFTAQLVSGRLRGSRGAGTVTVG